MKYKIFVTDGLNGVESEDGKILINPSTDKINLQETFIITRNKVFLMIKDEMVLVPGYYDCRYFDDRQKNIYVITEGFQIESLVSTVNGSLKIIRTMPNYNCHFDGNIDFIGGDDSQFLFFKESDGTISIYDFINEKFVVEGLQGYSRSQNFLAGANKRVKGLENYFLLFSDKKYNILYKGKVLFSQDYKYIATLGLDLCNDDIWTIQLNNDNREIAFYDLKKGEFKRTFSSNDYRIIICNRFLVNLTKKEILDINFNVRETFDEFVFKDSFKNQFSYFFCLRKGVTYYLYRGDMNLFYQKNNVNHLEACRLEYYKDPNSSRIDSLLVLVKVKKEAFLIDLNGKSVVKEKLSSVYSDEVFGYMILISFDRKPIFLQYKDGDYIETDIVEKGSMLSTEQIIALLKYCVWSLDYLTKFIKSLYNNSDFLSKRNLVLKELIKNNLFSKRELERILLEIPKQVLQESEKDLNNINNIIDKYPRKELKPIAELEKVLESVLFDTWKQ